MTGSLDIVMIPVDVQSMPAIILELKLAGTAKEMKGKCQEALRQIKEKQYEELPRDLGCELFRNYGMAFYQKRCMVELAE